MNKSCFGMVWLCFLVLFGVFLYFCVYSDKPTGIGIIDQFKRPGATTASPGGKRPKPRLPTAPQIE